jgi:hypothetical protein
MARPLAASGATRRGSAAFPTRGNALGAASAKHLIRLSAPPIGSYRRRRLGQRSVRRHRNAAEARGVRIGKHRGAELLEDRL